MGIPSYFSYVIRNHPKILRTLMYCGCSFEHLYMDCNSIIYDTAAALEKIVPKLDIVEFETRLIQLVMDKIDEYIFFVKPTNTVYIAFDGVAPLAKWQQQQSRRAKTSYFATLRYGDETETDIPVFDKLKITTGTEFMNRLSMCVETNYRESHKKYKVNKVIISSPNEEGEGEHKLFEYMRQCSGQHVDDNVAVYGLDSDLIMLSILHLKYVKNIYIFREAPEFLRSKIEMSVEYKVKENEPYFIDIDCLSRSILNEMWCKYPSMTRVHDYVFLCFFLGNDFLPRFPFLNIRTHGLQVLLETYRNHIGNYPNRYLICSEKGIIEWDNVYKIIKEISKIEHELLLREHTSREKFEKWIFHENTAKEKEENVQNIPIIYRAVEKYICPTENFWRDRYYKVLFFEWKQIGDVEKRNRINGLSANYIEGLDWVYTYYTKGCGDWCWKSETKTGILMSDIILLKNSNRGRVMRVADSNIDRYKNGGDMQTGIKEYKIDICKIYELRYIWEC